MSYPPPQSPNNPGQPPTAPPQQKSKATPVVLIILGIVLLLCLGCGGFAAYSFWWAKDKAQEIVDNLPTDFPTAIDNNNQGGPHTVRYEVTGSGEALITWSRGTGGQGTETVTLPWSKEITVAADSFGTQVFAFPNPSSKDSTALESCKIIIDGTERKTAAFANNTLICSFVFVS